MKGYCRDEGPKNVYLDVGLVRGHLTIQGWLDLNEDIQISYGRILVIKVWESSLRRNASSAKRNRGQMFDLPSRTTHRTILLVRISIKREWDKGKLRNI